MEFLGEVLFDIMDLNSFLCLYTGEKIAILFNMSKEKHALNVGMVRFFF